MKNNEILIGSHVSMNAPNFFLGSVQEAISYNSTAFMFYTGAPQNSYRVPLDRLKIEEGKKLLKEAGIEESHLVVHAPYIINPANKAREDLYEQSINTIINEMRRTEAFGAGVLVLHPGAHVGQGTENSIKALAEALNRVFKKDGTKVKIAIETMAGKGTEIGITFEQVKAIIDGCEYQDRIGVCLDTCHISDGGYDIHDVDGLLNEFDNIIGLDKLLVVHLNDSKNPRGAHKDRHENIGYGEIGFETLNKFVHHPLLVNIPKILETPYINEKPPYKQEIQMLKDGKFIDGWKENF
ncbi:MAG: deoxyribonuclease IV [Bacilli bacterium]|nr:deoxyribonuclease IV [Bacilli bacterium]